MHILLLCFYVLIHILHVWMQYNNGSIIWHSINSRDFNIDTCKNYSINNNTLIHTTIIIEGIELNVCHLLVYYYILNMHGSLSNALLLRMKL